MRIILVKPAGLATKFSLGIALLVIVSLGLMSALAVTSAAGASESRSSLPT